MSSIKLPKSITRQHVGFIGSPGTGKTQGMMQLFESLGNAKKIIVDIKGDYISMLQKTILFNDTQYVDDIQGEYTSMHKKDTDLIFCPLDKRTLGWNIFNDIKTYQDITNISFSLIPESPNSSGKDDSASYFDNAARSVLEGVLITLSKRQNPNNKMLWDTISSSELIMQCAKTDREARQKMENHLGDKGEGNQAQGVFGTIMSHVARPLEALSRIDGTFSFKEWTKNENNKQSIFLVCEESILDSMLPLYRVVIEIVASELLSMPDDEEKERELYFWLDEFPRLKKLRKVIDLMTLARSKGGRVIYAVQTLEQLIEIYQKEGMRVILGTTNTLFVFSITWAEELEKLFGQQEVLEYSETRTWGPHDMRDGGSHTKQKKMKFIVLASEIQRLENLEFYLKTIAPDITKAKLQYIKREIKNPKFVPNLRVINKVFDFNSNPNQGMMGLEDEEKSFSFEEF